MDILLSLPPNIASNAAEINALPASADDRYYCNCDPVDRRLGSGSGTSWLIKEFERSGADDSGAHRIIIHAGGQSRRLPAYAATGKSLTPVPVLRWAVGEKIDQTLLTLQLPLLKEIMEGATGGRRTMIVSGDVLIRNEGNLPAIPEADVVCYGLWAEPTQARNHGVFFMRRNCPERLDFMLQKPSTEKLRELSDTHYYLMDIGIWVLSERAMELLHKRSIDCDGQHRFYDLYSSMGCALGLVPSADDEELSRLSVAIVPMPRGEFYHFGTTRQMLESTLRLQNLVADQRRIVHRHSKPNPALFVQNCVMGRRLTEDNCNVWVENAFIGPRWNLTSENVVTGVPDNDWALCLEKGQCIDVTPVDADAMAIRPYGYDDPMRGDVTDSATIFLGKSFAEWAAERSVGQFFIDSTDIQQAPLFPVLTDVDEMGLAARWMTSEPGLEEGRQVWLKAEKISADAIMERAALGRLFAQRRDLLRRDLPMLVNNPKSIFYQLDLEDTALKLNSFGMDAPAPLPESETTVRRMRNLMLRSRVEQLSGKDYRRDSDNSFAIMREAILSTIDTSRAVPRLGVYSDQIVWGRSPVRIDLAGGWTDTPPYSLTNGGAVVNVAVELNGQPPLQVFIKPSKNFEITLRSIDLGAEEHITDYLTLTDFARVGSPFSLPKAALAIAGFAPGFSAESHASLRQQLEAFGSGIELTLLSALPAGSGMGTSSILAATVLGALSDFCNLGWTDTEICSRTLALEQLLTSGGGWQDQYGGVLQGIKLLQSEPGFKQTPSVSWLPDGIFTDPAYAPCHLLYYTGLTRTAKNILTEIVRHMTLNDGPTLRLLSQMKDHALKMADTIQRRDFESYGRLVGKSWQQNKLLDSGTCPDGVRKIIDRISDLTLGLKLPGAGGGGYLYMVAKDPEAASRIRRLLTDMGTARFAEMRVSDTGLKISRS